MRVIHSGVWGFASSPFVTEDEIKKITAQATEVAKASAISKRFEVKLVAGARPTPDYWAVPVKVKPEDVSLDDKIAFLMKINEAALKVPGIIRVQSNMAFDYEWKYLATSEGSYIEQEIWRTRPASRSPALKDGRSSRAPSAWRRRQPATKWCVDGEDARERGADLRRGGRSTARRRRSASGSRTSS